MTTPTNEAAERLTAERLRDVLHERYGEYLAVCDGFHTAHGDDKDGYWMKEARAILDEWAAAPSLLQERDRLDVEQCGNCEHPYVQHTGRSIRSNDMERLPGSRLGPIKPRWGGSCEATAYPRSNREDWHHTCPCSNFRLAATPTAEEPKIEVVVGRGDGTMDVTLSDGTVRRITEAEYIAWPRAEEPTDD